MSFGAQAARTQLWLEGLGEWSWPGRGGAAADFQPPSWVPAFPPRLEVARSVAAGAPAWQPDRTIQRRLGLGAILSGLATVCVALSINGTAGLERLLGVRGGSSAAQVALVPTAIASPPTMPAPLPTLSSVSHGAAGSSIAATSYPSAALHGSGSFLVYLPAGYAGTDRRYPVLYLLHGNNQPASAFLQIGLQRELDRLIARHQIAPLIAVMIQGGRGANNWRNLGALGYESYVLEVQELIDRMLPTVARRAARAIAGDSMGGYGAMHVALDNPYRFAVVESWLGFFNGLDGTLRADRPILSRIGLHAFVYGGEADRIADPGENPSFAGSLRAAGSDARSAVYPGGHSLETLQAHLSRMLVFAARNIHGEPSIAGGPPVPGASAAQR
jgi:enterochelin esterase-like enzyme